MYDETVAIDLRLAADLVERALSRLNPKTNACECCGVRVFENFDEGKVAEQLGPVPDRLRGAATRLSTSVGSSRR